MNRVAVFFVGLAALSIGACEIQQVEMAREEAADIGERVQILRSHDGRYSKHGWNHYGPGYFELDAEAGILKSHGGMGLFWYAAREYGDFVLELEFMSSDGATNSGVFVRVPPQLRDPDRRSRRGNPPDRCGLRRRGSHRANVQPAR
jgi:hypothetical protein